eukprot:evm.model.scf_772EXC.4 EVM.evm.TU.scf_772EXC.4   scf_772EXC:31453-42840(-)
MLATSSIAPEWAEQNLVLMLLDIREQAHGQLHLWGATLGHEIVLVHVDDFHPYFYIPAPLQTGSGGKDQDECLPPQPLSDVDCDKLRLWMNECLETNNRLVDVQLVKRKPIMYYRPKHPEGEWFLKLTVAMGGNVKKTASMVANALSDGRLSSLGFQWKDTTTYEEEVKPIIRFLCDTSLSGSSWISIPPGRVHASAARHSDSSGGPQQPSGTGFEVADSRDSNSDLEVIASWRALRSLTPDIVDIASASTDGGAPASREGSQETLNCAALPEGTKLPQASPHCKVEDRSLPVGDASAMQLAREGAIVPLKTLTMDVVTVPKDGSSRTPNPTKDPIVIVACDVRWTNRSDHGSDTEKVVFLNGGVRSDAAILAGSCNVPHVTVVACKGERDLVLSWQRWLVKMDPDVIAVFQARDTLGALQDRFRALGIKGGVRISRLTNGSEMKVSSVVMYSPAWVKSQARMASTSNQETWKVDVEGRVVFDILRLVLTAVNLSTFTLTDCTMSLLNEPVESVPPCTLAAWWRAVLQSPGSVEPQDLEFDPRACLSRLCRYAMRRVDAVMKLMDRLAVLSETVEMARVTGLTLPQVMYNAQMIRSWSLILRHAHQRGFIVGGRLSPAPLSESPYLMHPLEQRTTGLYKQPVTLLDFASLYPSLFCAYNMCYSTLVHPDDVRTLGAANVTVTPTGAVFAKPDARRGLLPSLLAALMHGRALTKAALKRVEDKAQRQVLDSRQKALKVVANAMYGFTGSQASPLQCLALADSCLALGASTCRRSREIVEDLAALGALGPGARGARVIYAQTDSLFILFPEASVAEAFDLGQRVAGLVSGALPPEISLAMERVFCPFMLLHVNRYAGRSFQGGEGGGEGALVAKGVKSMWRQAAPVVSRTLQGALQRILMENDVPGAVRYVSEEIQRLLSGDYGIWHTIMTGGLWRVTGQQIEKAALEGDAEDGAQGPHTALAVRLQQRDPDHKFSLGERLQYVLLAGFRTQNESAEDPVVALKSGMQPDFALYWRNKLMKPLCEIFSTCLDQSQLQNLTSGPHTMVHVDRRPTEGHLQSPLRPTGLRKFFKRTAQCLGCKRTMAWTASLRVEQTAPGSSPGHRPQVSPPGTPSASASQGLATAVASPAVSIKSPTVLAASVHGDDSSYASPNPQGMASSSTCQGRIPRTPGDESSSAAGLCESCAEMAGKWEEVYLRTLRAHGEFEASYARAAAACLACHSGGLMGRIVCENSECPVFYSRLESDRRREECVRSLERLDW